MTCHGNTVKNTNCPKDQYMVVKTASYRGLSDSKTCGLSDGYSCEVNVTCLLKKQCDGQHECSITVDNNLFSGDPCPALTKYLYLEYQCGAKRNFGSVCGTYGTASQPIFSTQLNSEVSSRRMNLSNNFDYFLIRFL